MYTFAFNEHMVLSRGVGDGVCVGGGGGGFARGCKGECMAVNIG